MNTVMFLDCPAYMDADGGTRCGLPAYVKSRYVMNSTGGPLESATIRCPAGHFFNGPVEFLALEHPDSRSKQIGLHEPGAAQNTGAARGKP
jgi:hypothetical protein